MCTCTCKCVYTRVNNKHIINDIAADRRPNGRRQYNRNGRRAPRRPRPPPQDSQGEDKTEGTEGTFVCERVYIMQSKWWG